MYPSPTCAQISGINLASVPSLGPGTWGCPADIITAMARSGSTSCAPNSSYCLTCIDGKLWVDWHNSLFWTVHLYSREFGECNLPHIQKKKKKKSHQRKCRILLLFSQNNFYIRKQSRNWPGSGQKQRAGCRPSYQKLRVYRKEKKEWVQPLIGVGWLLGKDSMYVCIYF